MTPEPDAAAEMRRQIAEAREALNAIDMSIHWICTEDQHFEAAKKACKARCKHYGDLCEEESPLDCQDCEYDVALKYETEASRARRKANKPAYDAAVKRLHALERAATLTTGGDDVG